MKCKIRIVDIISRMKRLFRTWYLLFKLKQWKYTRAIKIIDLEQIGNSENAFFNKKVFLKEISYNKLWIFPRNETKQKKRMIKDEAILEICKNQNPPLIKERTAGEIGMWRENFNLPTVKEDTKLICITGHGEAFADISELLLIHLPGKYKTFWGIVVGAVGSPVIIKIVSILIDKIGK